MRAQCIPLLTAQAAKATHSHKYDEKRPRFSDYPAGHHCADAQNSPSQPEEAVKPKVVPHMQHGDK